MWLLCVCVCVEICIPDCVCLDACMHNGAYNLFSVVHWIHTCQPGHASCPSLPDNAEWMHAIILRVPVKSEKTCIPLSPSLSVACSDSAPVQEEQSPPLRHSHQVNRRKSKHCLCFSFGIHLFIQPITEYGGCPFFFIPVGNWCMLSSLVPVM